MESSEDDAGLATSASRRASARETDTGQAEDVEPTREPHHGPPAPAASCRTPAMSEDTDGDSVASPSQQDVNTSTEEILDMIDEFVDGPGAPRRLPLSANRPPSDANESASLPDTEPQQQTDNTLEQPRTSSPTPIAKSETLSESTPTKQAKSFHSEVSVCANTSIVSPTPTSSVSVDKTESSNCQTENSSVIESKPVVRSDSPSSSVQTVPNIINSECEQTNRTINVTSSDKKDSVTVERAESTSSECSVSESRGLPVEPSSRSPLRRRLVRPAPSDRRPDCTVSSTVHSQTTDVHSPQPMRSEVVVKDVSSSSDTVALHSNLKPDGISNVSEISICKAETSTAPKKIRLVRPKVTPIQSNSVKTPEALSPEKEQCQSTSCDERASSYRTELLSSRIGSPKPIVHDSISADNCLSEVLSQPEIAPDMKTSNEVNEREENSQSDATPSINTDTTSESSNNLQSENLKLSRDQSLLIEPPLILNPSVCCTEEMASAKSINILTEVLEGTERSKSKVMKSEIQSTVPKQESELEAKEVHPIQQESTKGQSNDLKLIGVESKVSKESNDFIPLNMQAKQLKPESHETKLNVQLHELESKQVEFIEHEPVLTQLIKKTTVVQSEKLDVTDSQVESDSQVELNKLKTKAEDVKTIPMESKSTIEIQTKELTQKREVHTIESMVPVEIQSIVSTPAKEITIESKIVTEVPTEESRPNMESKESEPTEVINIIQTNPAEIKKNETKQKLEDHTIESMVPVEIQSIVSKPAKEIKTMESKLVTEAPTEKSRPNTESKELEPTEAFNIIESNPAEIQTEYEPVEIQSESEKPKILTVASKPIDIKTESDSTEIQAVDSNPVEVQSKSEPLDIQTTKSKPIKNQTKSEQAVIQTKSDPTVIQTMELKSMDNQSDSDLKRIQSIDSTSMEISTSEPAELHTIKSKSLSIHSEAVAPIENKSKKSKNKTELEISKVQSEYLIPIEAQFVELERSQLNLRSEIIDCQKSLDLQSNDVKAVDAPSKGEIEVQSKELDSTEPEPINSDLDKSRNKSQEATTNSLDEERKLPPIKLTLTKVSKAVMQANDLEAQSISNKANAASTSQDKRVSSLNTGITDCDSSVKLNPAEAFREQKKVPPIKLNLTIADHNSSLHMQENHQKSNLVEDKCDSSKQVPKLTIKLGNKQADEIKSPIPKLTIKPIRPPTETEDSFDNSQQFPSVTKLNIKPVVKPVEIGDSAAHPDNENASEKIPNVTKLNIKPIPKPAEKINDVHRKSSSSEISESEYSENDESPSTSDHASASDQGPPDAVPKLTIKLGKPGTESEGKFYTEKNVPKLTIKGLQQQNENDEKDMKLKLVISQSENIPTEKVPKLTIKTVTKSDSQPLSPKLTIKPIRPPENDTEIPKLKISSDSYCSSEIKENMHVPKITIKAVTKQDSETGSKTPKKATLMCDSSDHNIPIVTKLNIKPVLKPIESGEGSEDLTNQVPVVSKLNIKPIVKPKDNEVDSSVDDVPKIIKLNIKPLKSPEENSSEGKDCDETRDGMDSESIPVVTKLNIKPIVKPEEDEGLKDSENQSSETGTSSDDNSDHIPVVTKLNIKPIVKPSEMEEVSRLPNEQIPVVTKLNIKPLVRPEESSLPSSPKRESLRSPGSSGIPVVTKLNIKPIVNPEDTNDSIHDENLDKSSKNPPLVMKINMKNVCDNIEQKFNSYFDGAKSPRQPMSPKVKKSTLDSDQSKLIIEANLNNPSIGSTAVPITTATHSNCLPEEAQSTSSKQNQLSSTDSKPVPDKMFSNKNAIHINEAHERSEISHASPLSPGAAKQKKSLQNCTLLKQLLSNTRDDSEKCLDMSISNCLVQSEKPEASLTNCNLNAKTHTEEIRKYNSDLSVELDRNSPISEVAYESSQSSKMLKSRSIHEVRIEVNESVTKPLEIITDKVSNQSSGQDSPRIILKINKTDHGSSAKIITEESHRPKDSPSQNHTENTHETAKEKLSPKKQYVNHKRKQAAEEAVSLVIGKRLRSSRVVDTPEKPSVKRNAGKRSSVSETSPTSNKDNEMSILDSKRLKLEHLLSANKGLTITPVASKIIQTSPPKCTEVKQGERTIQHPLLKNDNCSKNGNSKLHNILSSLQAKQMQSLQMNEATMSNKDPIVIPDAESNASTGSSDVVVEISRIDNCHPQVQEMIINENSEFRDISTPDDISQDPLEVDALKIPEAVSEPASIKAVEVTPTPRKRGRPRKIPIAESPKPPKSPTPPALPVPALEERPQRSLRLTRERPVVVTKPRGGRGRGRGGRRAASPAPTPAPAPSLPSDEEPTETVIVIETVDDEKPPSPVDPTSSRIKLPRMTEALDKSSACMTPLSSRRRSSTVEMKLFGEPSVVIENVVKIEEFMKSPEASASRGRGGRGRGTPRGRTPRGRGRGRGGGKGATYMKETMGIYGRVCGPATTTVELFEEETCMMDDNATPKPSHLLDEDSQSSVKSSTNESSNKMKKSKFADLFDSNKVWTASDVKEYMWPPPEEPNVDHQVMMIQEQVAMFLGVKSFKRRYVELKRRAVVGEEKEYVLRRGIVTEALCDLGITAVDASDVLDIMLSDYPHKYEEYRSHQRQRQLTEAESEDKPVKVEVKAEKQDSKPEPPKVDPEKTRQDMAAAAIASAAEWNAMANAWRRPACVDLQSNTIHRRRAPPPAPPPTHCRPPAGFYPHAVLPHQYQHAYRVYTPAQLRYFPLNTVIAAPPAPPSPVESSSESEGSWADPSSSSDDSRPPHHSTKRKKLTKVKRSSQQDKDREESRGSSAPEEAVDVCRVCKLRLEANRKYTHERFLVCAHCNAKLHPSCLELNADTIRKCREYPWQCAECKSCCACRQPKDDDKMLFCDLCDRGFHIYCVGLAQVPQGRWHCVECAVCKSCGAHEPSGLAGAGTPGPSAAGPGEWHHQTRRGPGGHKVYSHSLCTPCARAYRIGRYCPLCERSFIGPKGTMQLVICKLCDRQLHQDCVRATVSALNVMDYTCGECRRGGITSRAAAVRVAPRTIATLFMAKRRFNKYAHRQYLASRRKDNTEPPPPDASDSETLEASDPLDVADNSRTDFGD